jgi:hypothetical protein
MDLIQLFATLILVTTLITLAVAVAAYAAYKLREKRRPLEERVLGEEDDFQAIFLEPFEPARGASASRFSRQESHG